MAGLLDSACLEFTIVGRCPIGPFLLSHKRASEVSVLIHSVVEEMLVGKQRSD